MSEWMPYFWLVVLIIMAVFEGVTTQLVSIWFVAGAAAALITCSFTSNILIQTAVFVGVSFVLLIATRPFVHKLGKGTKLVPTNADRCIGQSAVVIEDIDDVTGKGQVKVAGSVWSAVSSDGSSIKQGRDVTVLEIKGVKLVVKPTA